MAREREKVKERWKMKKSNGRGEKGSQEEIKRRHQGTSNGTREKA